MSSVWASRAKQSNDRVAANLGPPAGRGIGHAASARCMGSRCAFPVSIWRWVEATRTLTRYRGNGLGPRHHKFHGKIVYGNWGNGKLRRRNPSGRMVVDGWTVVMIGRRSSREGATRWGSRSRCAPPPGGRGSGQRYRWSLISGRQSKGYVVGRFGIATV